MQPTAGQEHTYTQTYLYTYTHEQEIGAHTNILGIDD